jgi:hypothetical protein
MGSRSGYDADLELDELQNVIDRGSGAVPVAQRQLNAQFNLGLIQMAGNASGGAQQTQVASEAYAVQASAFALQNINTVQKVFGTSANGALTLVAGATYGFEGQYLISESGTSSHTIGMSFAGTATYTYIAYTIYGQATSANANPATGGLSGAMFSASNVTATPTLAAAGNEEIAFYGVLKVNAGGTFIPSVTYSAAPGAAPSLLAGSYIFVQPLVSNLVGNWS